MVKQPPYTPGCHCCEARMRNLDRSRNFGLQDMVSRVDHKFRIMKKEPRKVVNKNLVRMADLYLDEIRERPQLIKRYKDFAGVTIIDPVDDANDGEITQLNNTFALCSSPSIYKKCINNVVEYVAKRTMNKFFNDDE